MIAPCLKDAGTIGLCSPSHVAEPEKYRVIIHEIQRLGFRVKEAPNLYSRTYGYSAAPEERGADFNALVKDSEVELVLFGGGEGSNELLPYIDFDAIAAHPKRFSSYSDGTTILNAIWAKTGLGTYYGFAPGHFIELKYYDYEQFRRHLMEGTTPMDHASVTPWRCLREGRGEGVLVGGYCRNFAMLLNSAYYPIDREQPHVLFLEDHERFGGVDYVSAMLTAIELDPFIHSVKGLLFGHYALQTPPELWERLKRFGEKWQIPVAACDDFGHGANHATLRIGHPVVFNAERGLLHYE